MATLQDYLGITALRDAWPKWKANVVAVNNQVINHVAGSADKHLTSDITNDSEEAGTTTADAINTNKAKVADHVAGTADKHAAQDITYTGDFAGKTEVKAALDQAKTEIDTIVVNASIDPEVAFARDSAVKSKVFGSLDARLEESEQDRVTDKADNATNIKTLGAKGDGVTDDTAIIASALANANIKALYFPKGYYLIFGTGTEILNITRGLRIFGDGNLASSFLVDLSTPITTDVFRLHGVIANLVIEDMGFVKSGAPIAGKNMIHIDLSTVGDKMYGSKISRCYFDPAQENSIKLTNVNADGFFTSLIEDCTIYGGINLENSGDSISIVRNKIGGANYTGIKLTTQSGAMRTLISENNITSGDGAIDLFNCDQVSIINNQIEGLSPLVNNASLITVNGGNNIIIEQNNLDNNGFIANCVDINNTLKASIDKNSFHTANTHIIIGSGCKKAVIGQSNVARKNGAVVNSLVITDNSVDRGNTFLGKYVLDANTIGTSNVGIGESALASSTTGTNNTSVGYATLNSASTASYNTALGSKVLKVATTGYGNVGIGSNALVADTTGFNNVGIGMDAMLGTVDGYNNVGIGLSALQANTNANANVGVGVNALLADTTGSGNTGVGFSAGSVITTGAVNTFIGKNAGQNALQVNGTNSTAIGANAYTTASNAMQLGDTAVTNVGTHGDFETQDIGDGFICKSPNGTRYRITVSDAGAFLATTIA